MNEILKKLRLSKNWWTAFSLALGLQLALGCSAEDKYPGAPRVAYVTNGVAPFWVIAKAGAEQAGEDLSINVSVHMPAEGISDQKRILEDLLIRGTNGIAVSPIDPANQTALLNQVASEAVLITHDSDAPDSDRQCYIGVDNYVAGRLCGKLVKEALPDGGKIMIFIGRLEQDNARRRRQGVIDEIFDRSMDPNRYDPPGEEPKNERYQILGTMTDQFDNAKGKANAEDALSKHSDLNCMVGLFAYNPPLCLEALRQAGALGKVKVVAFDEADETLLGIEEGTVVGTVVQNPYEYGYQSVKMLAELAVDNRSSVPQSKFVDIPARVIRQDNVVGFRNDLHNKMKQD